MLNVSGLAIAGVPERKMRRRCGVLSHECSYKWVSRNC